MAIFCLITTILLLCAAIHILRLHRQMAWIRKQLDDRLRSESMHLLSAQFVDRQLIRLTGSINDTLLYYQSVLNESRHNDQVVREMLAGVSHDLRTPLTAIKGNVQLLMESDLTSVQEKVCGTIMKHTNSMEHLAEHFWEYTYHTVVDVAPAMEKISITNIVSDSIATLVPAFEVNGLAVDFTDTPQLYINADREFCERIVLNLLRNCISYSAGTVHVAVCGQGENVELSITNPLQTGTNIEVNRLFEKFYSAEQSRTRAAGLGLYLVRLFAEKMGGTAKASLHDNALTIKIGLLRYRP